MFSKKISLQNPERIISPKSFKVKDLNNKDLNQLIDIFKDRIEAFYIKPIEYLINKNESDYGFAILSLCFTVLDTLSLYFNAQLLSDEKYFVTFMKEYLKPLDTPCKSGFVYYKNDIYNPKYKLQSSNMTLIEALWRGFRHGIIHNGKVSAFGQYDYFMSNLYREDDWTEKKGVNRYELWLNPRRFFKEVKGIFNEYIRDLKKKSPKTPLIINFIIKFRSDFGNGP